MNEDTAGRLVSLNVGLPRDVAWQGRTVRTGIWKDAVEGPRMVRRLNVDGDGQGDLAGHGGEQRAVFVYQLGSYRYWERELGRDDFVHGQFGENFTVEASRVTVASLWDSWKEEWESLIASGERSPRSLVNVQGRIRKYVIPTIGTTRVTEVKSHHVVKVLNAGRTAGLSSASLDSLRDVSSGLLQHGVDTGVTQRNVARDLPKSAKPKVTAKMETLVLDAEEDRPRPRRDTQGCLPHLPSGAERVGPARGRVPWPALGEDRLGDKPDLRHAPTRAQRTSG